jgi:hypothetical protein
MIKPEQIPPEVVEAAARATWDTQREHWGLYKVMLETEGHLPPYEELGRGKQRELLVEAHAAIAAALNAWPGAGTHVYYRNRIHTRELTLPLPQEARDE